MKNIKPLHNNVLIEPLSEEERGSKTKSGIFIPETVDKEKPDQGKIIEVGAGKRNNEGEIIPMSVKKDRKSCSPNTVRMKSRLEIKNILLSARIIY